MTRWEEDQTAGALYIHVSDSPVAATRELSDQVAVDTDVDGKLVGLEIVAYREPWDIRLIEPYRAELDELTLQLLTAYSSVPSSERPTGHLEMNQDGVLELVA